MFGGSHPSLQVRDARSDDPRVERREGLRVRNEPQSPIGEAIRRAVTDQDRLSVLARLVEEEAKRISIELSGIFDAMRQLDSMDIWGLDPTRMHRHSPPSPQDQQRGAEEYGAVFEPSEWESWGYFIASAIHRDADAMEIVQAKRGA